MENIIDANVASAFDPKRLELILLSTEKCNFRCTYCYEDFAIGKMAPEVIRGVKALVKKRVEDLEALNFEWFGGEPLVARDVVFEISEYAKELCDQKGVRFWGGLTTNGSRLDRNTLQRLVECGMRSFQISLDGHREVHNTTRIKANGAGTFDEIWGNLISAAQTDLDFSIMLRLHVTSSNIESVYKLLDQIYASFGSDKRFKIFFHKVNDLGGNGSKSGSFLSYKEYNTKVKDLSDYAERLWSGGASEQGDKKSIDVSSEADLKKIGYICYAAKPNSLLIRADGRLGKCTVAFDDARNTIGKINPDGTLSMDNDKLSVWMKGFETLDREFLACPLSKLHKYEKKVDQIPVEVIAS